MNGLRKSRTPSTGLRLLKFALVGAIGIGVQLAVLAALSAMNVNYLAATAIAVECALLHNFLWHCSFTWADRTRGMGREPWVRLLRFHLSNGGVSLGGNLLLMRLFVGVAGMGKISSNALAIALCSSANFALSNWFVFAASTRKVKRRDVPDCLPWTGHSLAPACAARKERK
ncbi:MAG: GtrA family protein [Acidobacteriales bacterium]|nr:GtrA family protein [Terriglobales bacterium]